MMNTPFLTAAQEFALRVRRAYCRRRIRLFRALHATRPASLSACMKLQSYAERTLGDPLAVAHMYESREGTPLFGADPELRNLLEGYKADGFVLRPESLEWLAQFLEERKPRAVLEFGSGYSTLVQCAVLQRLHGPRGFRLLSVEQDRAYARNAEKRLQGLPGAVSCRLVHVPLVPATVEGTATSFYDFSVGVTEYLDWLGKADFVFIDGPFADGPCRYGTLPAVRDHLAPSSDFALDDGLGSKELPVGSLWERDGICIHGVLAIGNGIMIGKVD